MEHECFYWMQAITLKSKRNIGGISSLYQLMSDADFIQENADN